MKAYQLIPINKFHTEVNINSTTGSEIVTTSNAKDYMRVDTTADDTLIGQMVTEARIIIENYLTKDIVAKTRSFYLAGVDDRFVLPFSPIASIQSITIDGTATKSYSTYGLDDTIVELEDLPSEDVIVNYTTSGMSDSLLYAENLQLISTLYDNRADFVVGATINEIPTSVKSILSSYKTMFI